MSLTNEELRQLMGSMVQLNDLLRKKRKEIKEVRDTYKQMCDRVKQHSKVNGLQLIRMGDNQLRIYEQLREPSITADFLLDSLGEFFRAVGGNESLAKAATEHVKNDKKSKRGAKSSTNLALRKVGKQPSEKSVVLDVPSPSAEKQCIGPEHKRARTTVMTPVVL